MAEQDRIEPDGESREPEKRQEPAEGLGLPLDEDAAWQAIVAGYGQEPADPPGAKPFKSIEDLALLEPETNDTPAGDKSDAGDKGGKSTKNPTAPDDPDDSGSKKTLGGSVSFAPGVGGGGPRDYDAPEASDDDLGADDEGHFVPPEPPPLPAADVTAKFAWLAVLGGPLLLLLTVLLGWQMTWWLATLSIGGFLGGFATLVSRMKGDDDEENEDPGRGAVV
ncbi:hypothetical protein AB0I66_15090 [Streptomyces sp. NPDC050439]|uniref:hypothetical protein n=1 Tax=unclassified Streptomyces TaxID=2593676 RepID=UPI003436AFDF